MIARIVPNSPFTTILHSHSQKYNGRGDWLISGINEDQPRGVEVGLAVEPCLAPGRDVGLALTTSLSGEFQCHATCRLVTLAGVI